MKNHPKELNSFTLSKFNEILNFDKLPKELVDYIKEVVIFRNQLTIETERGSALYAVSYLEAVFDKLFRKKLIGNKKHLDDLLSSGALGTFSNKINICFSIGLINADIYNDLHIIRKVRNEFGHSPNIITFDDDKISDLCRNLRLIARENVVESRQ